MKSFKKSKLPKSMKRAMSNYKKGMKMMMGAQMKMALGGYLRDGGSVNLFGSGGPGGGNRMAPMYGFNPAKASYMNSSIHGGQLGNMVGQRNQYGMGGNFVSLNGNYNGASMHPGSAMIHDNMNPYTYARSFQRGGSVVSPSDYINAGDLQLGELKYPRSFKERVGYGSKVAPVEVEAYNDNIYTGRDYHNMNNPADLEREMFNSELWGSIARRYDERAMERSDSAFASNPNGKEWIDELAKATGASTAVKEGQRYTKSLKNRYKKLVKNRRYQMGGFADQADDLMMLNDFRVRKPKRNFYDFLNDEQLKYYNDGIRAVDTESPIERDREYLDIADHFKKFYGQHRTFEPLEELVRWDNKKKGYEKAYHDISNTIRDKYKRVKGIKRRYQMGGGMEQQDPMMDPMNSPSTQHMQGLAQNPQGMPEEQAMGQEQEMQAQLQQLAQMIVSGDEQAMQQLQQLPPEIQQQVMMLVEQMQAQQPQQAQGMPEQMMRGGKMNKKKKKRGGKLKRKNSYYA